MKLSVIAVANLQKGTYIRQRTLYQEFNTPTTHRKSKAFELKKVALMCHIKAESKRQGDPMFCTSRKDDIYILTDREAATHINHQHELGVQSLYRKFREMCDVDTTGFPVEEKKEYLASKFKQEFTVQVLRRARKVLQPAQRKAKAKPPMPPVNKTTPTPKRRKAKAQPAVSTATPPAPVISLAARPPESK